MASSVTVWTSDSTDILNSKIAEYVRRQQNTSLKYDSITIAKDSKSDAVHKITDAFNRLVSITSPDPCLHIIAVIPMYEESTPDQLKILVEACSTLQISFTLHILGLAKGIQSLFVARTDSTDVSELVTRNITKLKDICLHSPFSISYSLIDNYAANGAPINFSINSLAYYISLFQTAVGENYFTILTPALVSAHPAENLSVGVASLYFDRAQAARQLLGRGFLAALSDVGVNDKDVDAQKAANRADQMLASISSRYPNLFEKRIRPMYHDQGLTESEIVAQAPSILDNEIDSIKNEILSIIREDNLSLPEKESVLAMILGQDNPNIRGVKYQNEGTLLDDACDSPLNLYIDAFNNYCEESRDLPLRKEFKSLKIKIWDDVKNQFVDSPENDKAFNPLSDIKALKQEIINITSFIRGRNDELKDLEQSIKQSDDLESIRKVWQKPSGQLKDIEYKEQPLDDKYSPAPDLQRKNTVDLRKFFSPVKNQKDLGSCTSFAAAAMYEAMMARNGVQDNNMSAAFLYYHSNIINGRPDGGSNFFEQLKVLGSKGICREALFEYDADNPSSQPSEAASEDAGNHRVLSAKQIPLINEDDKSLTLKQNHNMLTAALSEGYPVGISLKVFDNLGKSGPFILHPADTPEAQEDGWHAMVIAGYSEENDFYIVRNSWGEEFGENGYCYIPSAYIDDPDYLNFACIITEITDTSDNKAEIPTVIADFRATETEIRMATIRNVIAKQRVELDNKRKQYEEFYKYYQRLVLDLTIPSVQRNILQAAQANQVVNYNNAYERMQRLESDFVNNLQNFKKQRRLILFYLCIGTLGMGIATYFSKSKIVGLIFLIIATITVFAFIGYKWSVKNKRRQLQDEVNEANEKVNKEGIRLLEMKIRFHIAGMWITRFHTLSMEINNVYNRLVGFNTSLRGWQKDYTEHLSDHKTIEGEMFRSLDASPHLEGFFDAHRTEIVDQIDLLTMFGQYQISPQELDNYHLSIQKRVTHVIDSLMENFNIVNFMLGDNCPFLTPINLPDEIGMLLGAGQPSFRNPAQNASSPVRIILANVERSRNAQWEDTVNPLFPMHPFLIPSTDATSFYIITIHPIDSAQF